MKHLRLKFGSARSGEQTFSVGDTYSTENEKKAEDLIKSGSWEDITESVEKVKADEKKAEDDSNKDPNKAKK